MSPVLLYAAAALCVSAYIAMPYGLAAKFNLILSIFFVILRPL